MNGIVLQIVCYVAALASFAPWPEASAESSLRPAIFTIPPTTTFNPKGTVCSGFSCPLNRVCAVSGKRAICVCPYDCPIYINRFCGSDNQTYNNDCELQRQSCLTNKTITKAYYGECKLATACDGFPCPTGTKCAIDERIKPVCVCAKKVCPYEIDMVCGTDGRTYGSECEVLRSACITATNIRIAYKGYCLNGTVCSGFRCPKNKQCNVNQNNEPVCVCSQSCPEYNDPVCGSDGINYLNLCYLKMQACNMRSNITMVRKGRCIRDAFCDGDECPNPKTCVVNERNQRSCVCNNNCGNYYEPVCGSDNKTYDNYYWFNYAACQRNLSTNYYMGVCAAGSNCEGIYCPTGQHCDSQHQSQPKCVCDIYCPKTYSPVCGSNNMTYNNTCELLKDACLTNTSIWDDFKGRCEDGPGCSKTYCSNSQACVVDERNRPMCVCSQSSCVTETTGEVCGSDGTTYNNYCVLIAAACMTNTAIEVQRYEPCENVPHLDSTDRSCNGVACSSDRHCEINPNEEPICVCGDIQCNSSQSLVCGSDKKTHNNLCELQKKACISSSSISFLDYGACVVASACDKFSCPPYRSCAIDEQYQATCVCFDNCIDIANQDPVCGSDGFTYSNECEMQKAACIANKDVSMKYRGKCDKGGPH